MHLLQPKIGVTGGPQYFLHHAPRFLREILRWRGSLPVLLQTPYGIAPSPFMAVSSIHKLTRMGNTVRGRVGKDRIQAAGSDESIGEAIRRHYALPAGERFSRIDIDGFLTRDGQFV